jgi:hypothetical protein
VGTQEVQDRSVSFGEAASVSIHGDADEQLDLGHDEADLVLGPEVSVEMLIDPGGMESRGVEKV